jgi:hypothetical protein
METCALAFEVASCFISLLTSYFYFSWWRVTHTPRELPRLERVLSTLGLDKFFVVVPTVVSGDDFEWAHHVVGFVLEDVAVVEVFAGVAFEANDYARNGACRALNGVFPAKFIGGGWLCRCNVAHFFGGHVLEGVKGASVEDLEAHQMDVHGVGVFCLVDELPDFGGVEFGKLGGGLMPVFVVEQHDHGVLDTVLILVEGDGAGGDGGGFGDTFDCAKGLRNGNRLAA